MQTPRPERPLAAWRYISGLVVLGVGVCVMIGWSLHDPALERIDPGLAAMKFNAALCLALLGAGLAAGVRTRVARVASVFAGAIAVITLAEYVTASKLGIDEAVFRDAGRSSPGGRMALTTAVCLLLAAGALHALRLDRPRLVTWMTLPIIVIGWLGCLGYLFGVKALYAVGTLEPMAAHTAASIVILGVGLLASSVGGGLPWIARGDDPGATVLRRILPSAFLGMPLLAYLALEGSRAGWYEERLDLAIAVMGASIGMAAVAVYCARAVNRSHAMSVVANRQLRDFNAGLEARIAQRTAALARSETWAHVLANSAPIGIFHSNANAKRTYVNDRFCEIYGTSRAELLADDTGSGIHVDDRRRVLAEWADTAVGDREFDCEFRVVQPTGTLSWVHAHASKVPGDADGGRVGTVEDITARRDGERALREAEALFRTTFESSPVGIALLDGGGRIIRANPAARELTGHSADELCALRLQSLLHPDDADGEGIRTGSSGGDQRILRDDGSVTWVSIRYAPIGEAPAGSPAVTVAQLFDTTVRHHFEDKLVAMANHDPLTGLLNRRSFEVALKGHVAHCRRYGPVGAVLMLDLDHFKQVNDTHGHLAGDQVLVATARRLRERLRESDAIARLGGDEFVVLLGAVDAVAARTVARSLLEKLGEDVITDTGVRIAVTASIGIAAFDHIDRADDEMLANADIALYEAKARGRATWAEFTDAPDAPTTDSFATEIPSPN